jgi:hypothetical protein
MGWTMLDLINHSAAPFCWLPQLFEVRLSTDFPFRRVKKYEVRKARALLFGNYWRSHVS